MKNLFYVIILVCLLPTTINAQQLGFSSNTTFNTDATGGQVGHLQSGTFGSVTGGEWIGIGEPNVGPAAYGMRIQKGTRFNSFSINNNASEIFWGGANSILKFKYAADGMSTPVEHMSIRSNGKTIIGDLNSIGNNTSYAALTVVETVASGGSGIEIEATTNRNPNLLFSINSINRANIRVYEAGGDRMDFQMGSSLVTAMTILQNRNVGIGTTNPTDKLHVNGNISASGLSLSSDQRFKKDITKLDDPMRLLEGLNGVSYEYDQEAFPEKEFVKGKTIGFIAQDFEKDLSNLIKKDNEGYYAVNYLGVIPILVEAMKDVNEENQTLKEENEAFKEELSEIKSLLNDLIKAQDLNGKASKQSGNNIGASKAALFQNAPNPSNGSTNIRYQVADASADIMIVVNDLKGNEITKFANLPSGNQSVELNENLNTGIYLYSLYVDGVEVDTKRLVVSK